MNAKQKQKIAMKALGDLLKRDVQEIAHETDDMCLPQAELVKRLQRTINQMQEKLKNGNTN